MRAHFSHSLINFRSCLLSVYRPIICGSQETAVSMRGIKIAFECMLAFYFAFKIHDHMYSVYVAHQILCHLLVSHLSSRDK